MKPENRQPGCAGATARPEAILSAGLSLCRCRALAADRPSARLATPAQGEKQIPPRSITRRCLDAVAWIAPSVTLILLPKCPACLAAYVALFGVGISMTTSLYLRTTLAIVCLGSLVFLSVKACARVRVANSRSIRVARCHHPFRRWKAGFIESPAAEARSSPAVQTRIECERENRRQNFPSYDRHAEKTPPKARSGPYPRLGRARRASLAGLDRCQNGEEMAAT